MLATCQSEVASVDEGAWNSSTNLETIFSDEVQTITPATANEGNAISLSTTLSLLSQPLVFQHSQRQVSGQEYGPHSQEFVNTLSEGADPPELLFSDTPVSAGYELGTQPFQFIPEYSTSEGQTLSHSSANRHQELRLSVVQGGQEKIYAPPTFPPPSQHVCCTTRAPCPLPPDAFQSAPRQGTDAPEEVLKSPRPQTQVTYTLVKRCERASRAP
ncbi:hypothetical protein AZE42_12422 [Rhizopogon vesiculosus]|uniref:Uncharacterized protein n=1 Tax=Rhizopogon vesiculosus TaxID=180088 RepID=A0A1J8PP69_9AGAM|nr:hypothetical protein AZE42_12422 [Rhizopogon vesiculosus]